jgi:flagellar protein FlgJ
MLSTQNADVYTDFNGLAKLKSQARQDSPEALKEVAKQFESIFLNNVLKSMREAKLADGIMDNDQSKFFREMYDHQLAMHLSGSVGLADLIVKQMSPDKPKHDNSNNQKLDAEDYLNKSEGISRNVPVHRSYGSNQASGKAESAASGSDQVKITPYIQEEDQITEFPFTVDELKAGHGRPIHSAEEFIKRLHPYAEQAARELGVEPKVILAQAALESGWGRSVIKNGNGENSFNLFNIKADKSWQGKQAQVTTLEFDQGIPKKVNAGFRSYDSFQESFRDYVDFIKSNPRYSEALKKAGNAERYMHELQRAGYATDPKYADKVISIYQSSAMSEFEPDVIMAMNQ